MADGFNPYAAPADDSTPAHDPISGERVGGWLRALAWILDAAPMIAVNQLLHDPRVNSFTHLATVAISLTTEIVWAASPGMLLLGGRVARIDGRAVTRGRLVAKAVLVRLLTAMYLLRPIADALGLPHVQKAARDSALPQSGWQWAVMISAVLYFAAFAGAFTARRQTFYDRILGLAVFRRSSVRD